MLAIDGEAMQTRYVTAPHTDKLRQMRLPCRQATSASPYRQAHVHRRLHTDKLRHGAPIQTNAGGHGLLHADNLRHGRPMTDKLRHGKYNIADNLRHGAPCRQAIVTAPHADKLLSRRPMQTILRHVRPMQTS